MSPSLRVLTYNIRHALGIDNRVDSGRVAGVLAGAGSDLAGLQEVDRHQFRSCLRNQPGYLGRRLQRHWAYGVTVSRAAFMQYGNLVLSRWPLAGYRNHLLPGGGEQRGLLEAEIETGGQRAAFFCTHLGLDRRDRVEQVGAIMDKVRGKNIPLVLVGDFNDGPDSREYSLITSLLTDATAGAGLKTFPAGSPTDQLDFIFVSGHWRVVSARAVDSPASDHLAVIAEVAL